MSTEDIVLSVMAVLLSGLALGIGYYVLLEAVGVLREWVQSRRERRTRPSIRVPRGPDDTGPLPIIRPYDDRETLDRVTDHLKKGPDNAGE
jgi:hypothetical protein